MTPDQARGQVLHHGDWRETAAATIRQMRSISALPYDRLFDAQIVDYGIGLGRIAMPLLEQYPCCRIAGIDRDEEMLRLVEEELRPYGRRVRLGSSPESFGEKLDGWADLVLLIEVLQHQSRAEADALVGRCLRLLRHPLGTLFVMGNEALDDGTPTISVLPIEEIAVSGRCVDPAFGAHPRYWWRITRWS